VQCCMQDVTCSGAGVVGSYSKGLSSNIKSKEGSKVLVLSGALYHDLRMLDLIDMSLG
jgi:hypothetical protein